MFSRYYPPPEVVGRPLVVKPLERGKRHFWGEPGKNYGFFTTVEEIEMDQMRRYHRRAKSQVQAHQNNPQTRYRKPSLANDNHYIPPREQFVNKKYSTTGVQSQLYETVQTKEIGTSTINIKDKLQEYVNSYRKEQPEQIDEEFLRLPKIDLPKMSKESASGREEEKYMKPTGRFKTEQSQPPRGETIVYYRRRNRHNNPTYCNSYAYPLPCFRYVT